MKYALISFYDTGRSETDQRWVVYGWVHAGHCENLGERTNRIEALTLAHSFNLPVLQSQGERVEELVKKLSEK